MAWARQRSNGDWTGYYRDPAGKTRSAGTFPKERAAKKAAGDEETKMRLGQWVDPDSGSMTVKEYFEEHWLPNRRLGVNSKETYMSHWRTEIGPTFGHLQLRHILRSTVQGWITDMERRGTTPNTVRAKVKALQTILAAKKGASAERDGLLPQGNPCLGSSVPDETGREVQIYTPDQIESLADAIDPWYRMLIHFAVDSGCRWGELQGLEINDINFLKGVVSVRRTIVETKVANTGNGTRYMVKQGTKNGDPLREFRVTPNVIAGLAAHCQRLGISGNDHLFPMHTEKLRHKQVPATVARTEAWPNGLPMGRNHMSDVWVEAIKKAGVPYRRIHDLRASSISWLLSDPDVDQPAVMERVGHQDWATTHRYLAVMPDADDKVVAALERVRARFPRTN